MFAYNMRSTQVAAAVLAAGLVFAIASPSWVSAAIVDVELAAADPAAGAANSGPAPAAGPATQVDPTPAERLEIRPRVQYPAHRPAWIGSAPEREGAVHKSFVDSGPFSTRQEAQRGLAAAQRIAFEEYVDWYLNSQGAARVLRYDPSDIASHVDPGQSYSGELQFEFGPMYEEHAVLAFDAGFRSKLDHDWAQVHARRKLIYTGLVVAGVLALLATAYSYFRLDSATRGYYTRRLQFAAVVVGLLIACAAAYASYFVPRW